MNIKQIELEKISVSPDNARKITEKSVAGLAENIKAVGLIQPIVVRENNGGYELIAGQRRFEAVKSLGKKKIRADIVKADDQAAQVIRVTENLQRADLEPFEEALAIQRLLDKGMTYEQAAAELGKTPQFVARRARLLKLSPQWKKVITNGKAHLGVAAMELIASQSQSIQKEIYNRCHYWDNVTEDTVKRLLSDYQKTLKAAPWKLDDDSLDPKAGACTACQKRTGCQPLLFHDDIDEASIKKDDRCLDTECYNRKLDLHVRLAYENKKAEHKNLMLISREESILDNGKIKGRKLPDNVLSKWNYDEVKKKTPGARPALVIDGGGAGSIAWISIGHRTSNPATKKSGPATLEEKEMKLEKRRLVWIIRELRTYVLDLKSIEFFSDQTPSLEVEWLLVFTLTIGTGNKKYGLRRWKHWESVLKKDALELKGEVCNQVQGGLIEILNDIENSLELGTKNKKYAEILDHLCALMKLDIADYKQKAVEAIKRPKSWPLFTAKSYETIFPEKIIEASKKKPSKKAKTKKAGKKKKTSGKVKE